MKKRETTLKIIYVVVIYRSPNKISEVKVTTKLSLRITLQKHNNHPSPGDHENTFLPEGSILKSINVAYFPLRCSSL